MTQTCEMNTACNLDRVKKFRQRIEKTNAQFAKASASKKRVMIAEDILYQIKK